MKIVHHETIFRIARGSTILKITISIANFILCGIVCENSSQHSHSLLNGSAGVSLLIMNNDHLIIPAGLDRLAVDFLNFPSCIQLFEN